MIHLQARRSAGIANRSRDAAASAPLRPDNRALFVTWLYQPVSSCIAVNFPLNYEQIILYLVVGGGIILRQIRCPDVAPDSQPVIL